MKPAELRVLLIAVFSLVVFALAARESPRWVPEPAHKAPRGRFLAFLGRPRPRGRRPDRGPL